MRVLDLFSGIGGFSLGLEKAGHETVAFAEIEPFCQQILARHWPDVPQLGDITHLTDARLRSTEAEIITGGFPCQDVSYAGKGAGLAGERSGLWRELLRAIRVVRPHYTIVENVAALLRRGMATICGDLAESGLDAEWHCLSAREAGSLHRRERIFIIAHSGGQRGQGCLQKPFSRQPVFSWCENVRRVEDLRDRPDLYPPTLCGSGDGIPQRVDRLKGLGNAVMPPIAEFIGEQLTIPE